MRNLPIGRGFIRLPEAGSRRFLPPLLTSSQSDTPTFPQRRILVSQASPSPHGISLTVGIGSGWSHQGKQELVNCLSGANSPSPIGCKQGRTWGDHPVITTGVGMGQDEYKALGQSEKMERNWVLDDIPGSGPTAMTLILKGSLTWGLCCLQLKPSYPDTRVLFPKELRTTGPKQTLRNQECVLRRESRGENGKDTEWKRSR